MVIPKVAEEIHGATQNIKVFRRFPELEAADEPEGICQWDRWLHQLKWYRFCVCILPWPMAWDPGGRWYRGEGAGLGSDGNTDVAIGPTGPIIVHGDACALIRNAFSGLETGMPT